MRIISWFRGLVPLMLFASPLAAQSVALGARPAAFAAISVADVQRMIGWYRDTLGFEVLSQGAAPNGIARFATMKHGAALLELIQHRDARPRASFAADLDAHEVHGFFKAGFVVEDVDAVYRALQARGVAFAYPLGPTNATPYRSFGVRDPEGNLLQFFGP